MNSHPLGDAISAYDPDDFHLERSPLSNGEFMTILKDLRVQETRITNPDTGGAKGQKLARYDLLPWDVLEKVAEHFGKGAAKYEERNWERGYNWSLSYAALMRHLVAFWNGEDIDPENGSHHLDAVIFHAMALRRYAMRYVPSLDDRPR